MTYLNMSFQIVKNLQTEIFHTVYLANYNGQEVTAYSKTPSGSMMTEEEIKETDEAIANWKALGCSKYILCYLNNVTVNSNDISNTYVISEYYPGTFLRDVLRQNLDILPFSLWPLMLQMISGLIYIHDKGFAHRDICPDNIWLADGFRIKYTNFTSACKYSTCKIGSQANFSYESPENVITGSARNIDDAKKQDIWALGITFYEMANGSNVYPYSEFNGQPNFRVGVTRTSQYKYDDQRTNKFIMSILQVDKDKRPNADQLLVKFIDEIMTKVWIYTQ